MRSKDQILLENLYTKKILNEGRKERFLPMFHSLINELADLPEGFPYQYEEDHQWTEAPYDKTKSKEENMQDIKAYNIETMEYDFQKMIKEISEGIKKENLVVLALRFIRNSFDRSLNDMKRYGVVAEGERDEENQEMESSRYNYEYMVKKYPESMIRDMEHFISLPVSEIQRAIKEMNPREIEWFAFKRRLQDLEKEWASGATQWINVTDDIKKGNIKEFINFGKMGWFTLMRPYCEKEGKAMGHCGNKGGFAHTDTVLSLREMKREKYGILLAKPYLTFILKSGEYLGEMKGRANTKPKEEYHPYIIRLLTHKENGKYLIKDIEGGGYLPQNNFDIEDLSYENLVKLTDERPDLMAKRLESYFNGLGMIAKLKKHNLNMGDYEPPEKMIKAVMNSKNKDKVLVYFPKAQREAAEKNQ
jgi:hypothetical protein